MKLSSFDEWINKCAQLIIIFWKIADSWPRFNSNHSYNPRFSSNQVIYEYNMMYATYIWVFRQIPYTWPFICRVDVHGLSKEINNIYRWSLWNAKKTKQSNFIIVIIIEIAEVLKLECFFFVVRNSLTDVCHVFFPNCTDCLKSELKWKKKLFFMG